MTLSRRSLITGLVSFVAAPAIVRVGSIMPVKVMDVAAFNLTATEIRERFVEVNTPWAWTRDERFELRQVREYMARYNPTSIT